MLQSAAGQPSLFGNRVDRVSQIVREGKVLRWWRGIAVCLLLSMGSLLSAQPGGPACDLAAKRAQIAQKQLPDFTGCRIADAAALLMSADYQVVPQIDPAAYGVPRGIITRQSNSGRRVNLSYSSGEAVQPPTSVITGVPATETKPPPVRFSLSAPASVPEGGSFYLTVTRDRADRTPHVLSLAYRPSGLLDAPPNSFTFSGKDNTATVALTTLSGTPSDGDKAVLIVLTRVDAGGAVSKPNAQRVTITDSRPVQSYTIATEGSVQRDAPVTLVVTRADVADRIDPIIAVSQDGKNLTGIEPIRFAAGSRAWSTRLDPGKFKPCGGDLGVVVRWRGGVINRAVPFADPLPTKCKATPTDAADTATDPVATGSGCNDADCASGASGSGCLGNDCSDPTATPTCTGDACNTCNEDCSPHIPWLWIVGALIGIATIGYGLHKWPWWPPAPVITALPGLELPSIAPFVLGDKALRWPGARAQVHLEPGETHLPDHLPVESDDHG